MIRASDFGVALGTEWSISPSDVTERDVDVLVLEELYASARFRATFLTLLQAHIPAQSTLLVGQHSVATSTGQSDLEVLCQEPGGRVCSVLIENKIAANFQPDQALRYRRRGELYVQTKRCDRYVTVLVAPRRYIGDAHTGFDAAVTYEQILEWFEQAEELGDRREYKIKVLQAAIKKATKTVTTKNRKVTDFAIGYFNLVQQLAPELCLPYPKPRSSGFILFLPPATNGFRFVHKTSFGHVDIEFAGFGSQAAAVSSAFLPVMPPHLKVVKAHKSAALRAEVPKLSKELPVEAQLQGVKTGIAAAKELLSWWIQHRHRWIPPNP